MVSCVCSRYSVAKGLEMYYYVWRIIDHRIASVDDGRATTKKIWIFGVQRVSYRYDIRYSYGVHTVPVS